MNPSTICFSFGLLFSSSSFFDEFVLLMGTEESDDVSEGDCSEIIIINFLLFNNYFL
jgi:hypothetical protein